MLMQSNAIVSSLMRKATTQTSLDQVFKEVDRIESSEEPESVLFR